MTYSSLFCIGEPRSDYLRFCHGNCGAAVMGRERLLELACPILWVWTVFSPRGSDSVHRHKNECKSGAPSAPRENGDVLFSSAPEASLAGASYGTALGGFPQETARRAFLAGGSLGLSRHRRYERIRQARKRAIPTRRRSPFHRFRQLMPQPAGKDCPRALLWRTGDARFGRKRVRAYARTPSDLSR